MINFLEVLKEKRDLVWPEIKEYLDSFTDFPEFCRIPSRYQKLINFHRKIIAEYPERKGKYIRPALVLLTASAMGLAEREAIKTAAAIQVSEDWILNHDDIEDDSLSRRGKPALHQIYGKELAINAGDGLHVIMWRILRDNQKLIGAERTFKLIDEFLQMLDRTVLGQTAELKWTRENRTDLNDKDILFILESKTVYYTIAGPMRLGAILAGADQNQLDRIYQFGRYLGYCFQIQDDLLDLTSDFAGLKKQQGNDIYEGKRTIMLLHLFRNFKGRGKTKLNGIIAKIREEKTSSEVAWVIGMMEKYGSLDYGRKMVGKFAKQAQEFFDSELVFLKDQPARDQIRAFVSFLETRKY